MKKAITVLGFGAAAVAISVTNASALEQQQAQTSTSINLREQPSATSNKVSELQTGSKVTVKESQNGWANIQTEDGQSGWVSGYYVTDENGQSVVPAENTKVNPVAQNRKMKNDNNIKVNSTKKVNNVKNNTENVEANQVDKVVEHENSVELNSSGRIVSTPTLNLIMGPSTSYGITGVINKDETFKVVSRATNGWYKVVLSNGKTAWASGKYINLTASENLQSSNKKKSSNQVSAFSNMGRVNSSVGLNVRSGAGTNNQVVSTLNNNDTVEILGEESGWYKVRLENGSIGYVGAGFIAKTQANAYTSKQNIKEYANVSVDSGNVGTSSTKASGSVTSIAQSLLGTKYSWGGTSTSGFDCSGFTQYVYKKALGIDIPRVSRAQAASGKAVDVSKAIAGDLLYFDTMGSGTTSHVGIYLGGGKFIHASGTASNPEYVKISNLSESWVKCLGARRF